MGGLQQGLQGGLGGAASGGAFGGPWGALIGGGVGFLGGLLGDDSPSTSSYQDQLQKLSAGYGNRTAPQAGPASQAGYSGFRQNQAGLISQLEAMARGEGPSAASMQMREAMDRAAGAQASAAAGAGGRGVNAGAALRNASNNTAAIQSQGARDTGLMRVNEQLGAVNQLGQTIAQGRAGDENTNQFNAQANNQMAVANLQAKLQQLGLNDEAQLRALMGAMGGAASGPPGLGTQLLAGGASAVPGLLQWRSQQQMNRTAPGPGNVGLANAGGSYNGMAGGGVAGAVGAGYRTAPTARPPGPDDDLGWLVGANGY